MFDLTLSSRILLMEGLLFLVPMNSHTSYQTQQVWTLSKSHRPNVQVNRCPSVWPWLVPAAGTNSPVYRNTADRKHIFHDSCTRSSLENDDFYGQGMRFIMPSGFNSSGSCGAFCSVEITGERVLQSHSVIPNMAIFKIHTGHLSSVMHFHIRN